MGEPILSCHIGDIAQQDTAGFFKKNISNIIFI